MGVDCTLLPAVICEEAGFGFAHTMLPLERRQSLWPKLRAIPPLPIDVTEIRFSTYLATIESGEHEGECRYGRVTETPYGNRLEFARALDVLAAIERYHDEFPGSRFSTNEAVAAYLRCLPAETPVGLWWH